MIHCVCGACFLSVALSWQRHEMFYLLTPNGIKLKRLIMITQIKQILPPVRLVRLIAAIKNIMDYKHNC